MKLAFYTVRWWSSVDWAYNEAELIAENEAQVRAWVDTRTLPQFRLKPRYSARPEPETDSLTIRVTREVETLPFVVMETDL